MYIYRNVPFEVIWRFGWKNILYFLSYACFICGLHHYLIQQFDIHLHIPFSLIGPIGVAVTIYASFKNSQSYDRMWEARKNWGGLAVASRVFGNQLKMYLGDAAVSDLKQLVDRQIAYLQALKLQLRKRMPHSRSFGRDIRKYYYGEPTDADWQHEVGRRIPSSEYAAIQPKSNKALQLLYLQNQHLLAMREQHEMSEYKLMDIMQNLNACFENQGKNERIKTTPFPRQYAFFSKSFILIFILILPMGILDLYKHYSLTGYAFICLLYTLVAWLYITIELVGDNSEDPFENFITDIPMTAIIRQVEIDLYEMMNLPDVPVKTEAKNGVLM